MKERILKLLEGIQPDIDFENETALIDDSLLESFDVIQIVTSLMDDSIFPSMPTTLNRKT